MSPSWITSEDAPHIVGTVTLRITDESVQSCNSKQEPQVVQSGNTLQTTGQIVGGQSDGPTTLQQSDSSNGLGCKLTTDPAKSSSVCEPTSTSSE